MADRGEFTEAEKKQMEAVNRQFAMRQKYRGSRMNRRNFALFAGLLASVGGIYAYTLFATRQDKLDFED